MTEALTTLFDDISTHWGAYLTALVGLSALTMSLIQVSKELFFLRRRFHRGQVLRWLYPEAERGDLRAYAADRRSSPLEHDLLRLTAAGDSGALYDAELDDVCVQLSAASQMLVDYPKEAPNLLRTIAGMAAQRDLDLIIGNDEEPDDPRKRQKLFDARNRVRTLTHRAVEVFKLSTAAIWRRRLQAVSFVLSVLIALSALTMSGPLRDRWGRVVLTALLAGFLAPVARDLLAGVQQLRR